MDDVRVSVIVPAYNIAAYLPRCVSSLQDQALPDMEILLVDDGSTDDTGAFCDRIATEDPRIRVIHRGNGGLAAARNTGLAAARGAYVCFIDGDDTLEPGILGALWPIAEEKEPDVIRFGYLEVPPKGDPRPWVLPYEQGLYTQNALRRLLLDAVSYPHVLDYGTPRVLSACTNLFRRAFLERWELRFRSEREILNEDYLFMVQVMYRAESVYMLPTPAYHYITREGSLSRGVRPNMMGRKKALWNAYREILPGDDPEVEERLRNFYIDCVYDCFVDACTHGKDPGETVSAIGALLRDEFLQHCLRENRHLAVSPKTRCIVFLMRHKLAGGMCRLYRLTKSIQKAGK